MSIHPEPELGATQNAGRIRPRAQTGADQAAPPSFRNCAGIQIVYRSIEANPIHWPDETENPASIK
jgi:hypothetical protein